MKNLFLKQLASWLMLSVILFSCSKDDDGPSVLLPKLDGFYIYGTNTIAASPSDANARMALAVLDHSKPAGIDNLDGVYGKYLYIGANSKINFANVLNQVGTVYGAENGGTLDSAKMVENSPIKDIVTFGDLKENGAGISIKDEGLYYAYVNFNTKQFIIMNIKANIIGDATPLQWAGSTALPMKSTSVDSTVFEGKNIAMKDASGYRYRLNNGWAIYEDPSIVTLNSIGVLDYGVAWDTNVNDIGFYNDNIPHKVTGYYTIKLKFNASTGEWSEKKTKTGDVLIDYTDYNMSITGDATEGGNFDGTGNGFGFSKPSKSGDVYTWTWSNVSLIEGKEFIFLQDATWGGVQIDYAAATVSGTAITAGDIINASADPIKSQYPNYHVINAGSYDLTLTINAKTNVKTVIINENEK